MNLMIILISVVAAYLVAVVVLWVIRRRHKLTLLKRYGIPGPEPSFFSGNMYEVRREPSGLRAITSWLKQYGNVFGYYLGEVPYVIIKDLDMLKQVLIKDFQFFQNHPDLFIEGKPLSQTLLAIKGKRWKEVRSILTPTFSSGKIKLMTQIVNKKVDILVESVSKISDSGEMFDIYQLFQCLTLDVIADCAFAMKTHCLEDPQDNLRLAMRDFLLTTSGKVAEYILIFPFLTTMLPVISKFITAGQLTSFIAKHLESAIAARRSNPAITSVDFLQLMLDNAENGKDSSTKLTDEEVVANAFVFLLAGYETTSTALGFTLYMLVKHPEVQDRLYEEVQAVEDVDYTTVHSLQYLDQVFSESLRIYPPVVGFLTRTCVKDHQVGFFTIPKNAVVQAPVWDIHHDPELWPDPWRFDPERFSPENKRWIQNMSFVPFGVGPRNCIGSRFAQLQAKLALLRLLKKFKFEKCEKTEDPLQLKCPSVSLNPANGVFVRAMPRTAAV